MTLTEFLLARIAEDEANVERRGTYAVGHAERCIFEGGYEGTGSCDCGAVARVLAEVEAKRAIVKEHYGVECCNERHPNGVHCAVCSYDEIPREWMPCPTLRALASVYADHPEYGEEWRA